MRFGHHLRRHGLQLAAHGPGKDLHAARALEVVERIERFGDIGPHDDDAMAGKEQYAPRAEHAGKPVALGAVHHQAVIGAVVRDLVVEAKRILLDHLQGRIFHERERGGVRHVRVKHARGARMRQVNARMDAERRFLELALAFEKVALGVERKEPRGGDPAPVRAEGIEQKPLAVGEHEAEVIADAFVEPHARGEAKRRGELDASEGLHATHGSSIIGGMRPHALLLGVLLGVAVAACSKVNQESFAKIQEGMTEQEVIALLGTPTESNSVNVLGVSGTSSRWSDKDATITVRFVNGKVALKSFDKAPPR